MAGSDSKNCTLKCDHKLTGWAKETVLLEAILNTVNEKDIIAIQTIQKMVYFTFSDVTTKNVAKHAGLSLSSGECVFLDEADINSINITIKELPLEVTDRQIVEYLSPVTEPW